MICYLFISYRLMITASALTGKSMVIILFCWAYAAFWNSTPFFGWGKFIPEGILNSCSFDYLTRDAMASYFFE